MYLFITKYRQTVFNVNENHDYKDILRPGAHWLRMRHKSKADQGRKNLRNTFECKLIL